MAKHNATTWKIVMLRDRLRVLEQNINSNKKLSDEEKDVFKTFKEISQLEIIQQASIRQKYVDQAQSLNLNIPSSLPIREVNKLMIEAWQLGIKTLYYQRSQSVSKDFVASMVACKSCEG